MNDILTWMQEWFLSQCNGEWEHSSGIKIDSLDNPGWSVIIDLAGTELENKFMSPVVANRTEDDWVNCSVSDNQFKAYGGPNNLREILNTFKTWAEADGAKGI